MCQHDDTQLAKPRALHDVIRDFERLLDECPPEVAARQRVLTQRRGEYLHVDIRTTFRVPLESKRGE